MILLHRCSMPPATMTASELLPHMANCDVEASSDDNDPVVGATDRKRLHDALGHRELSTASHESVSTAYILAFILSYSKTTNGRPTTVPFTLILSYSVVMLGSGEVRARGAGLSVCGGRQLGLIMTRGGGQDGCHAGWLLRARGEGVSKRRVEL